MGGFWQGRKVLVTGGSGFLGSWLVQQLVGLEARVTVLVRRGKPHKAGIRPMVTTVTGDIQDHALLEELLRESEIRTVFHLAGQAIAGTAQQDPLGTLEVNVAGTWSVLEAARRASHMPHIVIASSERACFKSDDATPGAVRRRFGSTYNVSKACADLIAGMFFHAFQLPICIGRFANLYGGRDLHWTRLVPGTIHSVLSGKPPVIRSHGEFVRDFLYVEDAAAGLVKLAERMDSQATLLGETFDFSSESPLPVRAMVERILNSMGSNMAPVILNEPNDEPLEQNVSAAKARELLGWHPQLTFEEALLATISWYCNFAPRC